MAAAQTGRRGIVALFKRGWNEVPELMGAGFMALIGVGMGAYAVWRWELTQGPYYRRFKQEYVVLRDDDPRVKQLRTD